MPFPSEAVIWRRNAVDVCFCVEFFWSYYRRYFARTVIEMRLVFVVGGQVKYEGKFHPGHYVSWN